MAAPLDRYYPVFRRAHHSWGSPIYTDNKPTFTLKKITQIRRSSEIVDIGDVTCTFYGGSFGYFQYSEQNTNELQNNNSSWPASKNALIISGWYQNTDLPITDFHPRYRHNNSMYFNAGFVDGHAESIPYVDPSKVPMINGGPGLMLKNISTNY